jgi:hypothetical protein
VPCQFRNGGDNEWFNEVVAWREVGAQATAASRGVQLCVRHLAAAEARRGDQLPAVYTCRNSSLWSTAQPTADADAVALLGRAL